MGGTMYDVVYCDKELNFMQIDGIENLFLIINGMDKILRIKICDRWR